MASLYGTGCYNHIGPFLSSELLCVAIGACNSGYVRTIQYQL